MNYDPNLVSGGRMAKQTVRLTFGQWDYRLTMQLIVGGNCTGLTVIESALETALDEVGTRIVLKRGDDTLQCDDDEDRREDWLREMLIAAEIVAIEPDAEATKRWRAA